MHRQVRALWLISLLVSYLMCPDWQASGNMDGYLEPIRSYVEDAILDNLPASTFASNISARCIASWEGFWNVVVFWMDDPGTDICTNTWGFRDHWYWHTNYYGPWNLSFAVWKDVYCDFNIVTAGIPIITTSNTMITDAQE